MSSLDRLLRPSTVAIVGLSSDPSKHGPRALAYLRKFGFEGPVWGVNRKRPEVEGVEMFGALDELPAAPDAVIVAVPAAIVPAVLSEAAAAGAGGAVVFSGGFAELGEEGSALQADAASGLGDFRVVGPNSAGIVHPAAKTVMSFLTCLERPAADLRPGPVGLVSQSGGTGSYIHNLAAARGSGLAISISTGNEADLKAGEALEYLVGHPDVRSIALVLETVRDGPRFVAAAQAALAAGKPVVAFKLGRTPAGAELMATHTGALASPARVYDSVFRSLGIALTDSAEQLFEVAQLLAACPPAAGERIGIVTHSGGNAISAADAAHELGLVMPDPSEELVAKLGPMLQLGAAGNPADLGGIITDPSRYPRAVECFVDEPEYDSVVAVSSPHPPAHSAERGRQLAELAGRAGKPLVNLWVAGDVNRPGVDALRAGGAPVAETARGAMIALRALADMPRAAARASNGATPVLDGAGDAGALLDRLRGQNGGGMLSESDSKELLKAFSVPVVAERVVTTADEAAAAAAAIGYPVVLKANLAELVHKSDAGGVRLDIGSEPELRDAWTSMAGDLAEHGMELTQALVAEFAPGFETIVGTVVDRSFGPMVMVGLGGIYSEVLDDVALRLAPIGVAEALEMIDELRGVGLLRGARGTEPTDVDALARLIAQMSAAAAAHPDVIREIDLNPVIFSGGRWHAADGAVGLT